MSNKRESLINISNGLIQTGALYELCETVSQQRVILYLISISVNGKLKNDTYGIYGKYNRPYTEMRIKEQDSFKAVVENSLKNKVDYTTLEQYVNRIFSEKVTVFSKDELQIFTDCIATIHEDERQFYKHLILETDDNHVQNEIFKLFQSYPELLEAESFNLYNFINTHIYTIYLCGSTILMLLAPILMFLQP